MIEVKNAVKMAFEVFNELYDSKKYFVDSVWQVQKISSAEEIQ